MGYTYIGPNSIYKLAIPEMARLRKGWARWKEMENAAKQGIPPEKAGEVDLRNHPKARSSNQLRPGDFAVAERFQQN